MSEIRSGRDRVEVRVSAAGLPTARFISIIRIFFFGLLPVKILTISDVLRLSLSTSV